jgi:hypothetical protein
MNTIDYSKTAEMDIDDSHDQNPDAYEQIEDIEWELEHLQEFGNEKQLELLRKEIDHIMAHALIPSEGWYDDRFDYIAKYSQLDWKGLASRFYEKDEFMHNNACYLIELLKEIIEDRCVKPTFNLETYHLLIHNIHNIWNYYKDVYMGDETDADVLDLIEGLTFM